MRLTPPGHVTRWPDQPLVATCKHCRVTMAARFSERATPLPVLDTLKEHLPSSLFDQLRDFLAQLIDSRRALQAASETYKQERARLRSALLAALRIDQRGPVPAFLHQALEVAALAAAADAVALALHPGNGEDRPPLLVTHHCTEADEAFIKAELFSSDGVLERARSSAVPVALLEGKQTPRRVRAALAARHVKSALVLPFLAAPDQRARGILYLEHMSRPRAFQGLQPLLQACAEFIAVGVAARERAETVWTLLDHTAPLRREHRYGHLAGRSAAFAEVLGRLELLRVARIDSPVLLVGEPGTGKEALARTIHAQGPRAGGPFVALDCASAGGAPAQTQRLLGHPLDGTQASASRGLIFAARGGTLYLENIQALAPELQRRLLHALDMGAFVERDGPPVPFDVHLLAASPVPLKPLARGGRFSLPLAERLSLFSIEIPPLRERREDILPLAEHFLAAHARARRRPGLILSAETLRELERLPWPGNLDELRTQVETLAERSPGRVVGSSRGSGWEASPVAGGRPLGDWKAELSRFQRQLIIEAMTQADGHVARAAERLNISRQYLNARLKALGLEDLRQSR